MKTKVNAVQQWNIAAVISGLRYDSQEKALSGILEEALLHGDRLTVFACDAWQYAQAEYREGEVNLYRLINYGSFDGAIFRGDTFHYAGVEDIAARSFEKYHVPCVALSRRIQGMSYVCNDNFTAMAELTKHMVTVHGAKKVGIITGPLNNRDSEERTETILKVLKAYGISVPSSYIAPGDWQGDYSGVSAGSVVRQWIAAEKKEHGECWKQFFPDTLICENDEMAIGAIGILRQEGLSVPQDVRVVGYDNSMEGEAFEPGISTINQDDVELGRIAIKELRRRMETGAAPTSLTSPCRTIIRGSCGCPEYSLSVKQEVSRLKYLYSESHVDNMSFSGNLNALTIDFSTAFSYRDLYEKVEKAVKVMGIDTFALCVCKSSFRDVQGFGDKNSDEKREIYEYGSIMTVPVSLVQGKPVRCSDFQTKELIPAALSACGTDFFLVIPLHYQKLCYGYALVGLNKKILTDKLIGLMVQHIAISMENIRKQKELSDMVTMLNQLYIYDSLTGIMNRSGFEQKARDILSSETARKKSTAILFADMDNLKYVNDSYGHDLGDQYIRDVARILSQNLRGSDALMRYGGDEFVALCPGMTEKEARKKTETLSSLIESHTLKRAADDMLAFSYGLSIGYIIISPEEIAAGIDLDLKIEEADREMYKKKHLHRARFAPYDDLRARGGQNLKRDDLPQRRWDDPRQGDGGRKKQDS